jgi:hypothetical protein
MLINNLGFSAYLILKGYELDGKPNRDVKDGKFLLSINITKDNHDTLLREYTISEFSRFDNLIVNLKRMIPRY